jgi:hypothetical protein
MVARVKTRREAVEYLQKRGFYAAERDWALGETIVVATSPKEDGGITSYEKAIYLVPKAAGWTILELDRPSPDDSAEVSLAEACSRVERILTGSQADMPNR